MLVHVGVDPKVVSTGAIWKHTGETPATALVLSSGIYGVGNGLGGYHYFGEMGARPKQPGFGEVAPTLGRADFFSRIRLTRGGLGPNMIMVG
jgi:hypothetical protein